MRIQISLLLLPLLLLCDQSAAGSFDHGLVGAESEPRDGVTDELRLRKGRPKQVSHFERSAVNWATHSNRADFPCPDAAAIAPCVCDVEGDDNINLDCTFVESEEQLAAVFQQEFSTKGLHEFYMANNSAITVLGDILNGYTFETIVLSRGPFALEQISDDFFSSNKNTLTSLTVRDSQLTSDGFPFDVFSEMELLDYVYIVSNSLTWIPPITAPKISYLRLDYGLVDIIDEGTFPIHEWDTAFYLDNNDIQTVELGGFFFSDEISTASNGSLNIDLHDNQLQSLQAGTFQLRDGDTNLYLFNNQITSIEPGTFVLPETTEFFDLGLSLHTNQLTTVDEDLFGELMPYMSDLRLYDNPLVCGCDIAWLVLNSDFLSKVDRDATCADGTNLHDLDPEFYTDNC